MILKQSQTPWQTAPCRETGSKEYSKREDEDKEKLHYLNHASSVERGALTPSTGRVQDAALPRTASSAPRSTATNATASFAHELRTVRSAQTEDVQRMCRQKGRTSRSLRLQMVRRFRQLRHTLSLSHRYDAVQSSRKDSKARLQARSSAWPDLLSARPEPKHQDSQPTPAGSINGSCIDHAGCRSMLLIDDYKGSVGHAHRRLKLPPDPSSMSPCLIPCGASIYRAHVVSGMLASLL